MSPHISFHLYSVSSHPEFFISWLCVVLLGCSESIKDDFQNQLYGSSHQIRRTLWTTGHSDHAVTQGDWRFASPRLRLGIVASLLWVSNSIGFQHIVWLVYTILWEQCISSSIGSIRPNSSRNKFKWIRIVPIPTCESPTLQQAVLLDYVEKEIYFLRQWLEKSRYGFLTCEIYVQAHCILTIYAPVNITAMCIIFSGGQIHYEGG